MKAKALKANAESRAGAPSQEQLQRWIAEAAYYRAEKRGFAGGMDLEDWFAAEAEILARHRDGQPRI